jgi:ATP-binding cassette subfamily F protein 3
MLSGGERGRLALAKLALQDTNLLLLDEPTNHLDIPSQEVLQAVLDAYQGTILLVTHDRYLVDALATQIWEVNPEENHLEAFNGTYSQLKEEREKAAPRLVENLPNLRNGTPGSRISVSSAKPRLRGKPDLAKEERRRLAQLQQLENTIAALEKQLADLGEQLENPPSDTAVVTRLGQEYASVQKKMDEKLGEWENMQA